MRDVTSFSVVTARSGGRCRTSTRNKRPTSRPCPQPCRNVADVPAHPVCSSSPSIKEDAEVIGCKSVTTSAVAKMQHQSCHRCVGGDRHCRKSTRATTRPTVGVFGTMKPTNGTVMMVNLPVAAMPLRINSFHFQSQVSVGSYYPEQILFCHILASFLLS